jgi:poly-gamma-glutamate synthesis protein (capsule biosynthesis protein)
MTRYRLGLIGAVLLAALLGILCLMRHDRNTVQVAFLGQSVIEHDPRRQLDGPLADLLPILRPQEIVFTNLEVAICPPGSRCEQTRFDQYFHGADASVLDFLQSVRVNVLSLANNHAWDYGDEGILSTIVESRRRGLLVAGTGGSRQAACSPRFKDISGHSVGLIAVATANIDSAALAKDNKPGVCVLEKENAADFAYIQQVIATAAGAADLLIVYQHYQDKDDPDWQQRFARASIDAGASVYVSHGDPVLKGIEVYDNHPILYGLGNFIFHTKTDIGHYDADVWESVICLLTFRKGVFKSMELVPIVLDEGEPGPEFFEKRGYPALADDTTGSRILERLVSRSEIFGTEISLTGPKAILISTD